MGEIEAWKATGRRALRIARQRGWTGRPLKLALIGTGAMSLAALSSQVGYAPVHQSRFGHHAHHVMVGRPAAGTWAARRSAEQARQEAFRAAEQARQRAAAARAAGFVSVDTPAVPLPPIPPVPPVPAAPVVAPAAPAPPAPPAPPA